MADSTMLTMLKTDLGISTSTAYNTRLEQLLTVAQNAIIEEGASWDKTSKFKLWNWNRWTSWLICR